MYGKYSILYLVTSWQFIFNHHASPNFTKLIDCGPRTFDFWPAMKKNRPNLIRLCMCLWVCVCVWHFKWIYALWKMYVVCAAVVAIFRQSDLPGCVLEVRCVYIGWIGFSNLSVRSALMLYNLYVTLWSTHRCSDYLLADCLHTILNIYKYSVVGFVPASDYLFLPWWLFNFISHVGLERMRNHGNRFAILFQSTPVVFVAK